MSSLGRASLIMVFQVLLQLLYPILCAYILSEGMDEEATELPREPMKEPEDTTNPGESVSRQESEGGFQILLI